MSTKIDFEQRESAFSQRLYTFAVVNREHIDIRDFLADAFEYFDAEVRGMIRDHNIVKLSGNFSAVFEKPIETSENNLTEKQTIFINTRNAVIDIDTDLCEFYSESFVKYILGQIDEVVLHGSGFSLSSIKELVVQISRYEPLRASSYIDLPKEVAKKKAVVNVYNQDDMCFKWAILSALFPATSNPSRVTHYKRYENELNFTGIDFPVKLNQIDKFEKLNPTISINVYIFEGKSVRPVRVTQHVNAKHIHLLFIMKQLPGNEFQIKSHYCWIKDLSRLLTKQVTKHKCKHYFCDRCLNYFQSLKKLENHRENCMNQNETAIRMPDYEDNTSKFENYRNQLDAPFIIYADVEALLKKPEKKFCNSESTTAYQEHEVYSIGFYFKCAYDDSLSFYSSKRGRFCIDWFVQELQKIAVMVGGIMRNIIPLKWASQQQIIDHCYARVCHICEREFRSDEIRVKDHSHLTGDYRGAAHQDCNLLYVESRTIPVVFHNLSHYDSHFIIQKLATGFEGDISIIPLNAEKYISFTKTVNGTSDKMTEAIKLRFIDSIRFMASSLDYLSSLIPSDKKKILKSECKNLDSEQLRLLERKGIFCYDYVDSWEKLDETSLPSKDDFYSKLTNQAISEEDYQFAQEVWRKFNIMSLGEYSDLYLKTDVLLLADVFENFRKTCKDIYKLDPANYFTAPGLSFDAMLKYTGVKLELLTDVDMLLFIERGIRGGISQCSKRYATANNKYMDNYDSTKESNYLMYLDANNLYGHSMMQHLPHSRYDWCLEHFDAEKIMNIADDATTGYIFEVDLGYPQHLHDTHNDYPFCAENMYVPGTTNIKKLLLTLYDKKNYIIHYRMLKLALQHGLELQKVHRVMKFRQYPWLKPYIMLNTEMRTKATNDFEKNFFKLLCNAIFGEF